jgi:hypothetical protein
VRDGASNLYAAIHYLETKPSIDGVGNVAD